MSLQLGDSFIGPNGARWVVSRVCPQGTIVLRREERVPYWWEAKAVLPAGCREEDVKFDVNDWPVYEPDSIPIDG